MEQVLRQFGGLAIAVMLASCGSGGGSDSGTVAADTVRLSCSVVDQSTGKAVSGATVNYQSGTTEFATTTNADGSCELNLPATKVAGVAYPAATVQKPGYEPQTILCNMLTGGGTCSQDVNLIPLASNVSIPVGGDAVKHVGDDQFAGTVNSQFQKATDGTDLVFVIDDWAAKVKAGYTRATVYLDHKGWQTLLCENTIGLTGDVGTVTLAGGNSPKDGYWGGGKQDPFEFSVAEVGTQRAELHVTSGTCAGTQDFDDFEINRIRVYFD